MLQSARMTTAVPRVVVVVVLDAGSAESKRVDVLSGRTCARAHEMRSLNISRYARVGVRVRCMV